MNPNKFLFSADNPRMAPGDGKGAESEESEQLSALLDRAWDD
jgi:hypothetical protein